MTKLKYGLIAVISLAMSTPVVAQSNCDTTKPYVVAWDGTCFQFLLSTVTPSAPAILDANGNIISPAQPATTTYALNSGATAAALAAYMATHSQPQQIVTKLNFIRLLTSTEQAAFIVAQDEATALTAAQETASPLPPQTQALIGLKVFLAEYNALQPGDTINLTDPSTIAAVNLLLTLGVIPSQARVTAILAGQTP